jgi:hypothetical protein
MGYTFARVSAVARLTRGDYRLEGKRARLRMVEKGGKEKLVWLHHEAEQFLDEYLAAVQVDGADEALFPTLDKTHRMSGAPRARRDVLRIVKERCRAAGLSETFCNHTFRGTGRNRRLFRVSVRTIQNRRAQRQFGDAMRRGQRPRQPPPCAVSTGRGRQRTHDYLSGWPKSVSATKTTPLASA